jgi:cell division protease FtsH
MDISLAGRIAEEIIFGVDNAGTGAVSDLQKLSGLARAFVMRFGFSEKVTYWKRNIDNI